MENTSAFILSYQPYSDTSLLLRAICEDGEARTFLIKGARKRRRDKVLQYKNPLAWVNTVFYPSKSGDIFLLKEANLLNVQLLQNSDPVVQCMRLFAADFLQHWVRQQPSYSEAYTMAHYSNQFLVNQPNTVEFPLHLVIEAIQQMGLHPHEDDIFGGHGTMAQLWDTFSTGRQSSPGVIMLKNSAERAQLLQALLTYLSHSLPGFNKLKSISVIKELL